jgi:hypothetical protein
MDYLSIISQLLIYGFYIGTTLWIIRYATAAFVFSRRKKIINRLDARISVLKMHLRGKIKRKCNKIESYFKKDSATYIALSTNLEKISALRFDQSTDYQLLINYLYDITVKINDYIISKYRNLPIDNPEKPQVKTQDKYTQLVTYDKAHMIIIIEIIQTTNELRTKINEYNELTNLEKGHKKIAFIPDAIQIEDFEIISSLVEAAKLISDQSQEFSDIEKNLFDDAS